MDVESAVAEPEVVVGGLYLSDSRTLHEDQALPVVSSDSWCLNVRRKGLSKFCYQKPQKIIKKSFFFLRNLNGYNPERIKYMYIIHIYFKENNLSFFLRVKIINVHCRVS